MKIHLGLQESSLYALNIAHLFVFILKNIINNIPLIIIYVIY